MGDKQTRKRRITIILSILGCLAILLGALWVVQHFNKGLQDISIIVKNFQRADTLAESSTIVETTTTGSTTIYKIDNSAKDSDVVLEVDNEWVAGQKNMKLWVATPANAWTVEQIRTELEPTYWALRLKEARLGPWILYKDIYMNQKATYNQEEMLKQIFGN